MPSDLRDEPELRFVKIAGDVHALSPQARLPAAVLHSSASPVILLARPYYALRAGNPVSSDDCRKE